MLLVSTAVLADGRPTGIRIGRAVSGGNMNVEIDVTITDTDFWYSASGWGGQSTVWLGNRFGWGYDSVWQYASNDFSDPLPWAVVWGDGSYIGLAILFGPSNGPWQATFTHTYTVPGSYTIVAGDLFCDTAPPDSCGMDATATPSFGSGNLVVGYRYISATFTGIGTFDNSTSILAITNTAVVNTGTGIPTLNIYGLLALSLVLVGTGMLLFRKPRRLLA